MKDADVYSSKNKSESLFIICLLKIAREWRVGQNFLLLLLLSCFTYLNALFHIMYEHTYFTNFMTVRVKLKILPFFHVFHKIFLNEILLITVSFDLESPALLGGEYKFDL